MPNKLLPFATGVTDVEVTDVKTDDIVPVGVVFEVEVTCGVLPDATVPLWLTLDDDVVPPIELAADAVVPTGVAGNVAVPAVVVVVVVPEVVIPNVGLVLPAVDALNLVDLCNPGFVASFGGDAHPNIPSRALDAAILSDALTSVISKELTWS